VVGGTLRDMILGVRPTRVVDGNYLIATTLGVQKALLFDVAPLAAIIMGMFSALMGGVIRDTLINQVALIFKKEIYATVCLVGAAIFILLKLIKVDDNMNSFISVSVIIIIRTISEKYKLSLPKVGSK